MLQLSWLQERFYCIAGYFEEGIFHKCLMVSLLQHFCEWLFMLVFIATLVKKNYEWNSIHENFLSWNNPRCDICMYIILIHQAWAQLCRWLFVLGFGIKYYLKTISNANSVFNKLRKYKYNYFPSTLCIYIVLQRKSSTYQLSVL